MSTEKDRQVFAPQAKQEWERILEEALLRADGKPFTPKAAEEKEPEPWNLEDFLTQDQQDDPEPEPESAPVKRTEIPEEPETKARQRKPAQSGESATPRRKPDSRTVGNTGRNTGKTSGGGRGQKPAKNSALHKFRKNRFWLLAFLWLSLVFVEVIVRAATNKEVFWESGLFLSLLFAIAPAMLIFVVVNLFKNPKANKILAIVALAITYILYASQLIYYQVFGQFYTATSMGNADQGFGFMDTILTTIWENLLILLLMALPLLFVIILGKRFFSFKGGAGWKSSAVLAVVAMVIHFAVVLILPLWGTELGDPYDMYHYQAYDVKESASGLGLGTAFRLDTKWAVFGGGRDHGLELPEAPDEPDSHDSTGQTGETDTDGTTPSGTDGTSPSESEPVEYGYNVLDFDFEALAAAEGDSDIRDMHLYFNSVSPTQKNEKTGLFEGCNLILITAEGFSHLAIDPELTPTLYKMQTEGFNFTNFYTPIWGVSTSDGEYVAMTGTIPKSGVWSFKRTGEQENYMPLTMCAQLKNLGYSTYAYHNHTYSYYGRDLSHPNLGYIYKGMGNGLEEGVTERWPESDVEMIDFTTTDYMGSEPFHAYYMTVSGHLEYNFLGNSMAKKHKDAVADLPYSDAVKAYLACQIELDQALELLLQRLEEAGLAENTVIALTADHYPYGLTNEQISELLGHEVETNFELYRNACIIYKKGMTPETVDEAASSLDFLPTLCNLFGVEYDSRLYMGHDIFSDEEPLIIFQNRSWITDKAMYHGKTGEVTSLTGEEITQEYVKYIRSVVNNKFTVSANILEMDYWRILFGVQEE